MLWGVLRCMIAWLLWWSLGKVLKSVVGHGEGIFIKARSSAGEAGSSSEPVA